MAELRAPASFLELPAREALTFLHEHSDCLCVEQWLQQLFFKKGLGFGLTLGRVDCCVRGASRWAVKERRLGEFGALGEGDLMVPPELFAVRDGLAAGNGVRERAGERAS